MPDPASRYGYSRYLALGLEISASLAGPIILGFFLDQHFNTRPALLLSGIGVAILAMVSVMMRLYREVMRDSGPNKSTDKSPD